ncbi:MAG TPA: hypothetical protein VFS56_12380 [Gemmatimonadaceae bacterium]|nr:hypothetical protein [Gemmatimonadaceae bacterium]
MSSQREDYLLRLIRQVAEALRRLREALSAEAAPAEIERDAGAAIGELLGPRHGLLSSLDPVSAASLIADPRRVSLWSDLIRVQAAARRRLGDEPGAVALERRADDLEQAVS